MVITQKLHHGSFFLALPNYLLASGSHSFICKAQHHLKHQPWDSSQNLLGVRAHVCLCTWMHMHAHVCLGVNMQVSFSGCGGWSGLSRLHMEPINVGQLVEDRKHIFQIEMLQPWAYHVVTLSLRFAPFVGNSQKAIEPEFNKLLIWNELPHVVFVYPLLNLLATYQWQKQQTVSLLWYVRKQDHGGY